MRLDAGWRTVLHRSARADRETLPAKVEQSRLRGRGSGSARGRL